MKQLVLYIQQEFKKTSGKYACGQQCPGIHLDGSSDTWNPWGPQKCLEEDNLEDKQLPWSVEEGCDCVLIFHFWISTLIAL